MQKQHIIYPHCNVNGDVTM